tara:strand:- start:33 stop:446 length:414 start_codon:yes stop_codon:yes gene_type:complete
MSTLNVDALVGVSSANAITVRGEGTATTSLQQGLCKMWLHVSADGETELDKFNVSTHDDDANGDGGVHTTSNMASANYCVQLSCDDGGATSSVMIIEVTQGTQASGNFDYETNYVSAGENRTAFNVVRYIAVFGDLA